MIKKNNKLFPTLILISALSLSLSAAFCSVLGFMKIFAGASIIIAIIASTLEVSKVIIAASLQKYWNELISLKKIYLFTALFILIIITSAGIYGFLTAAYQDTANLDKISTNKIESLEYRKKIFETERNDLLNEKKLIDNNYSDLSKSFTSNLNEKFESKNKEYLKSINSRNLNKQINSVSNRKENISLKLNTLTDSVNNIDLRILNFKSQNNTSSELSSLKYISNLTNYPMDKIVNIFIMLIIFVFDPLALMLIVTSEKAYKIESDKLNLNNNSIDIPELEELSESEEIENIEEIEDNNTQQPINDIFEKYTKSKKKKDKTNKVITNNIPAKTSKPNVSPRQRAIDLQYRNPTHLDAEKLIQK